jgi:KDO2-lipid IV(A) lauroyltransferase
LLGAEHYAKLFDWPVVYCEMIKTKRGHYSVSFETITESPKELEKGELMNQYCQKLEETIQENPAHWLWSHRRWKRTKEEVFREKN